MGPDAVAGEIIMQILLALTAIIALAQAPPPTKAERLQDAARKGDAAAVKQLLDEGVDVNTKFRYNATALFYAADHGHVEVVKVLLDHGAVMLCISSGKALAFHSCGVLVRGYAPGPPASARGYPPMHSGMRYSG